MVSKRMFLFPKVTPPIGNPNTTSYNNNSPLLNPLNFLMVNFFLWFKKQFPWFQKEYSYFQKSLPQLETPTPQAKKIPPFLIPLTS